MLRNLPLERTAFGVRSPSRQAPMGTREQLTEAAKAVGFQSQFKLVEPHR